MKKELHTDKTSLLSQWKSKKHEKTGFNQVAKAPADARIPLTHNQRRLWFFQQLYPESPVYNYSELYFFRGAIAEEHLITALRMTFDDHDVLRSSYQTTDGEPEVKISSKTEFHFSQYDLSAISKEDSEARVVEIKMSDAQYAFDFNKNPLALVSLMKLAEKEYQLMLTVHHISTDKWSMDILRKDWARYYRALTENKERPESQVEIQFSDFAYWQNKQEVDAQQVLYWNEKLKGGVSGINLPTDYNRPVRPSFKGKSTTPIFFSKESSADILRLSKILEITPYVLFLSLFKVLLYRYSGQCDLMIGSPIASRDLKALENTIGFFNDTIVLRSEFRPEISFQELVFIVKNAAREAFSNKDVPFDLLVNELQLERSLAINPFFQVMFLYHSMPETPSFANDVDVSYEFYNPGVSKFDLTLDVTEEKGLLSFSFEYSTDLFKSETINRFQEHFKLLVDGVLENPKQSISSIPMISRSEKAIIVPKKQSKDSAFSKYKGIHEIIEDVCVNYPEKTALTYQDSTLTYGELRDKATILAMEILDNVNSKNEIIGLCVERSLDMIIGLLAILKAGCAYLPIDPKYPKERIDFVLKDANVGLVVSQKKMKSIFDKVDVGFLIVDSSNDSKKIDQIEFPRVKESDLAYIIYTSGSTGNPKGVPISHKNIINSTEGRLDFYPENPTAFLLMSSISFDSSKAGIFWTLCTGGNLVITENRIEQDIEKIESIVEKNQVSHTLMLPSLYRLILEHGQKLRLQSIKSVIVAGEACPTSLCALHFNTLSQAALYNEYGPTEATVWCIAHKLTKADVNSSIPLGRPVANSDIYLLDDTMRPVPIGAVGQIYIGGIGLSGRYLNRPDLTGEAYVESPFDSNVKLYKTGDLARYNSNGVIEFLGRSDQQVKIRGYRVELGEIEKAISKNIQIVDAVVTVETSPGESINSKRLKAFLTSKTDLDIGVLKIQLKQNIPDYMVPADIFQVEAFPTLPNGKIDKIALQKLGSTQLVDLNAEVELPRNQLETDLLEIWKEILKIDVIGIHDNFFELGGDSILSIQFISKAKKAGIALTPNQIFDYQTISELASYITANESQTADWDYLVTLRKEGVENPLFCIHAGGGHVFFYNVLTKYMRSERPIYALQAAGAFGNKEMHESIEQMAQDYIKAIRKKQPEGPYNIMVYCFSAAVGHEMVLQLTSKNQKANLIIMDTMTDPWRLNTPERLKMRIRGFAKRLIKSPMKTIGSMVKSRMLSAKLTLDGATGSEEEKAIAMVNMNLAKICSVYTWRTHQESVVLLLTEKPDASINRVVVNSWKKVALGGVRVIPTEGNHVDLFAEPEIGLVAKKIDESCI